MLSTTTQLAPPGTQRQRTLDSSEVSDVTEIQVVVSDKTLARQVEELAAGADVAVAPGAATGVALVVCDRAGLARVVGARSGRRLGPPMVLVAHEADHAVWEAAARAAVDQVVALPEAAALLTARLRALGSGPGAGTLLRVIGVRGGCGTTTVAVGLSQVLRDQGPVVLVDADPHGPGLEVPLGIGEVEGIRWPALADIRGSMPAASLTGRLPGGDGMWVLSHRLGEAAGTGSWAPVLGSLLTADLTVVADVACGTLPGHPAVGLTQDVLVMPQDLGGLHCARHLLASGLIGADPVVAFRDVGGPVEFTAVRAALAGAAVVSVPHSRSIGGAADFGDLADAVARGAFARACRTVAAKLHRRSLASGAA